MPSPARERPESDRRNELDFYGAAREVFNKKFAEFGLADWQIEVQSAEELERSLGKVDELLKKPERLGTVAYEVPSADNDNHSVVKQISMDATPFLFDAKVRVLRKILALRNIRVATDLKQAVSESAAAPDGLEREMLMAVIEKVLSDDQETSGAWINEVVETDEARQRSKLFDVEIKERKSAMYRKWLERESVASIIGSLLLLAFGVSLIVTMFTATAPTEIVTSTFLVILGYFFGQATSRRPSGGDSSE